MKKILNTCKLRFCQINSNDLIKIRLRGIGSGYKEGISNKGDLFFEIRKRRITAIVCK